VPLTVSNHSQDTMQVAFIPTHQWRVIFGAISVAMKSQTRLLLLLLLLVVGTQISKQLPSHY
jgi:hypothetical protein